MTIVILIDINILNVVAFVVVSRNTSIIQACVPLLILSLKAIATIRRIEVVSPIIVSCIIVVSVEASIVTLAIIVVVRTSIISLKVFIMSL